MDRDLSSVLPAPAASVLRREGQVEQNRQSASHGNRPAPCIPGQTRQHVWLEASDVHVLPWDSLQREGFIRCSQPGLRDDEPLLRGRDALIHVRIHLNAVPPQGLADIARHSCGPRVSRVGHDVLLAWEQRLKPFRLLDGQWWLRRSPTQARFGELFLMFFFTTFLPCL